MGRPSQTKTRSAWCYLMAAGGAIFIYKNNCLVELDLFLKLFYFFNCRLILSCIISITLCKNIHKDVLTEDKLPGVFSDGNKDNRLSENFDLHQRMFSSTKERPELSPILSELINDDIKKNIEAKRQTELQSTLLNPTTFRPTLTTDRISTFKISDGLVDQTIALDEAGTENKQVHFY